MNMTKIICENCGKQYEKPTKEINRQIKKGRNIFYCSLSCSSSDLKKTTKIIKANCLFCGKEIDTTTHKNHKKCCNRTCAAKYAQLKVSKDNHRKSVQRKKTFPINKTFVCIICGNPFVKVVRNNKVLVKTCGNICFSKLRSKLSRENPNCGGKLGYRRFRYKGFSMDSRWEVELAEWMDNNDIKWDRSKKRYMFWWVDNNGNKRKYFPDFYLPILNIYLDPKNNYYLQRDMDKLNYVIDKYGIQLYYGDINKIKSLILNK